jgi:hypothetical protein
MPEDQVSASELIDRERRFQMLRSRARAVDLRIDVMRIIDTTVYCPIDLIDGRPVLGSDPATNVFKDLDELEVFLDAQLDVD